MKKWSSKVVHIVKKLSFSYALHSMSALILLTLTTGHLQAQTLPLFQDETPVKMVLTAPLTQLYREKKNPLRPYRDGSVSYIANDSNTVRIPIKVRTRGNFRRLNCQHPPLRLNFAAKTNNSNLFVKQNNLKLVAPCQRGSKFQQLIGLEYLAYKIFEEVSGVHFKTRLVDISYLDSSKKRKPWSSKAFLIEDIIDVGKRHSFKQITASKVSRKQMDLEQTALVELFQFFIGNTDYSTLKAPEGDVCCHNNRILGSLDGAAKFLPVPYDFDISGIVDAPYAYPSSSLPIESVQDRYFTGWCKEDHHFNNAINIFKQKQTNILQLAEKAPILNDSSRSKAIGFIKRFYRLIDNPKRVKREIIGRCRGQVVKG